jgi:hypothetical protein
MHQILYVDGFNFYYGVTDYWKKKDRSLAGLGWCDFGALVRHHFAPKGSLAIKYFTAPVTQNVELPTHRPGEHGRYSHWIRALETIDGLSVIRGFYKADHENPDAPMKAREEKQTDVNLAIEMIVDAFGRAESRPDHVFLLSDDCDLMPAIFTLKERAPIPIEITVLLPSSGDIGRWASSYNRTKLVLRECHAVETREEAPGRPIDIRVLDESILANSILPYELRDAKGVFTCPEYWRLSDEYLGEHCKMAKWRPDLRRPVPG